MRIAIVYDSATGTTKAAAEQMGDAARATGHECTVESIHDADAAKITEADALCIGSWTKGLFIIRQSPTAASLRFIDSLGPLEGKPAAVFATYSVALGKTLKQLATPLENRGARVTGAFKSKGPHAADGFDAWLEGVSARETV